MIGTEDGLAKSLYIRESRRIRAEVTVCEQHVSSALRDQAEAYPNSVGNRLLPDRSAPEHRRR